MSTHSIRIRREDILPGDVIVVTEAGDPYITVKRDVMFFDNTIVSVRSRYGEPTTDSPLIRRDGQWVEVLSGVRVLYTDADIKGWLDDSEDPTILLFNPYDHRKEA